ncbi:MULTISPECIES: DUF3597 domain-containing protein [Cupriavidus]|uniref:DUF3597 domain-containing protein n=1 Tax=Cupriavidus pinatubonensis (strain JMP 134 / LMG 1197) TaxID=264198 RepID=Q46ZW9_CUPPJ|nr:MULTISPECIES: DUF3597 domain-containing protein [Cupriavidus]QYY30152.1 DUF3597 domain-containing protein [Cupriavidus pinatubonensis]TPQ40352.1 DUF3597 domain-containing protein [Cupriavidus pinatubonensis]
MSIFKDILNKLLHRGQSAQTQTQAQTGTATATPGTTPSATTGTTSPSASPQAPSAGAVPPAGSTAPSGTTASQQQPLSQVDVEAVMDKAANDSGQALSWRTSIVDTLKALGVDSSLEHRKALAKELNYSGDTNDSAAMNTWLHKRVMQELAANGGKLPKDLTD